MHSGKLTSSSFGWFITLLGLASFDTRKPEVFGCINKDFEALARDLGVDRSTLSKVMKKLRELGLLEYKEVFDTNLVCVSHYWQYQTKIIQKLAKLTFGSYIEVEMLIDYVESKAETIKIPDDIEEIQHIIDKHLEILEKKQRLELQKNGYSYRNPVRRNLSSPSNSYISSTNSNYVSKDKDIDIDPDVIDIANTNSELDKAKVYEGYDY